MTGPTDPPYRPRPLRRTLLLALALLVTAALLGPLLGTFFALLACLVYAISAVLALVPRWRHDLHRRITAAVVYAAAALGCLVIGDVLRDVAEERGQPIVEALDRHRARIGSYPEALDELVPDRLPVLPTTAPRLLNGRPYLYRRQARSYQLCFSAGTLVAVCYDREAREWRARD